MEPRSESRFLISYEATDVCEGKQNKTDGPDQLYYIRYRRGKGKDDSKVFPLAVRAGNTVQIKRLRRAVV